MIVKTKVVTKVVTETDNNQAAETRLYGAKFELL